MTSLRRRKSYLPASVYLLKLGLGKMYFSYSMEARKNSQTFDQKVFLNAAVKAEALFHNETGRQRICNGVSEIIDSPRDGCRTP
jgi:hypothetical protein